MSYDPGASTPSSRELTPDAIIGRSFPSARRGLDPGSVRAFLAEVAALVGALRSNEAELVAKADQAASSVAPPPLVSFADLDGAALSAAVGSETARVLQVAHEAADGVLTRAEHDALARRQLLEVEIAELRQAADVEAAALINQARDEVAEMHAAARRESQEAMESTTEACRAMVDEARDARFRILSDLGERRRVLAEQIRLLRAGKDALAEVVETVANSVEAARSSLRGADDYARESAARGHGDEYEFGDGEVAPLGLDAPTAIGPGKDQIEVIESASPPSPLDDLFARLRSDTTEGQIEGHEDAVANATVTEVALAISDRIDEVSATELNVDAQAPAVERETPAGESVDDGFLRRRNEAIVPVVAELSRVLKRELRESQNELLHSLRELPNSENAKSFLETHLPFERIAKATAEVIEDTIALGGAFASEIIDQSFTETEAAIRELDRARVGEITEALASEITEELGRRLESSGADDADLSSAVGAAYRQWKGPRIESLAQDFACQAFSTAVAERASRAGMAVRWILDDGDMACSECDDNSLAGPQIANQPFPTGETTPPAHPGCRCLLVPVAS